MKTPENHKENNIKSPKFVFRGEKTCFLDEKLIELDTVNVID